MRGRFLISGDTRSAPDETSPHKEVDSQASNNRQGRRSTDLNEILPNRGALSIAGFDSIRINLEWQDTCNIKLRIDRPPGAT